MVTGVEASYLIVVGLGPGDPGQVPLAVWEALSRSEDIRLRTGRHPVTSWLVAKGIKFSTYDRFYEQEDNFSVLYRRIAEDVLKAAREHPTLYAVPGHPLVAEESVQIILQRAQEEGIRVQVIPAPSFVDAVCAALALDPVWGLAVVDALRIREKRPDPRWHNIVVQVYSRLIAAEVKLALMEDYPDDFAVTIIRAAGVPGEERIEVHPLYAVDRLEWIDHLTTLYLPPCPVQMPTSRYPLDPLVEVMAVLRSERGCPWDREQTHDSLIKYLLEETYEVIEALSSGQMHKLCEELGDLLLQIVFHAQIARENKYFDINDVVKGITHKMLRRHPHVFGNTRVKNSEQVLRNWELIKAQEQGRKKNDGLIGEHRHLPALLRAYQVQKDAARYGFDWNNWQGPAGKVREELAEVEEAVSRGEREKIAKEIGDLLFAVVNLARWLKVEPESALTATVRQFIQRFGRIAARAKAAGKRLEECTLAEMDAWWEEAKRVETKKAET